MNVQTRISPFIAGNSFNRNEKSAAVAIIGGGPAGLTAAYELHKHSESHHPVVFEESDMVGGIARTEVYKGYRYDIGGHRFFTKVKPVRDLWREVLPNDFLKRPRMSRIYYRSKYFAYPLKPMNALRNMGAYESCRILLSYAKWQVRPSKDDSTFDQWVTNRFGGRLFWHFFKSYTEKVWGIPCNEIRADWAAQRIKNLSLKKAVWNAISGSNDTTSLIEEFDYPRLGPGMMWEAFRDRVSRRAERCGCSSGSARSTATTGRSARSRSRTPLTVQPICSTPTNSSRRCRSRRSSRTWCRRPRRTSSGPRPSSSIATSSSSP